MEKIRVPVVDIDDYSCGYSYAKPVVRGVSLRLYPGQLCAVVGSNGAGKSSLLRGLAGLMPFSSGTASLCGRSFRSFPAREFSKVVALMKSKVASLDISVFDYVILGRTPFRSLLSLSDSRSDRALAEKALADLGIVSFRDELMSRLSDGQKQMVGLARAVVQQPRLLLLDEPTSNLDPRNAERVMASVRSLCENHNMAVVSVMHDVNAARRWADSAIVMANGKVLFSGCASEVICADNVSEAFGVKFKESASLVPSPDFNA